MAQCTVLNVLSVTFPFFALVLAGYVAVRREWLSPASIPGLNAFVLYFALPCMLFRFGATTPIGQLLDARVFGVYFLCALVLIAIIVAISVRRGRDWNNAAFGALIAISPNTGFMGVPLLVALFGASAAAPAIVTIVADLIFTNSLCVALSRLDSGGARGARSAVRRALVGVATNPLPWAIGLGAVLSAGGWALPTPLFATLGLLADAASPVALFTLGGVLARAQMAGGALPESRDFWPLAAVKLFVHPGLVFLAGTLLVSRGLVIDRATLTSMVLVAALPSASNVVMLAERYGADSARAARVALVSTALAFVTFSTAVALLTGAW